MDSSLGARVGSGKKFTTDTVPAMLSVLFEIELGRGGRKSWQIGPKMSFPFFFSLSVSLLKTCGIVSALYRLYKRSFLFFQLKRFSIEHKELWNVFSISIRKYHWTFYSIKLSTGLLVYRTVKSYFESFQSNRK